MIAKPLEPNEFFTPDGGVRLFLENTVIKPPSIPVQKIWAGSVHRTARILKEVYANEETGEFENDPPRFLKHAPFVYWKRALEEIHEIFAEELAETYTHPFRNARDVITPLLHQTFLTQVSPRALSSSFYRHWSSKKRATDGGSLTFVLFRFATCFLFLSSLRRASWMVCHGRLHLLQKLHF